MQIQSLLAKFDALNERERISVLLLCVIAIVMVFAEFFIAPLNQQYDSVDKKVIATQFKNKQLESQVLILNAEKNNAPSLQQKQQQKLKLLNEQVANLNLRLKENMRGLIDPAEMAKVLEIVLSKNTGLQLQSMESLASKSLSPDNIKVGDKMENIGVYHHGMKMYLTGSYLATLQYLKALDNLPWDFYWDVLELNVDKYPNASIVITVHTLSFHEDWIGV